MNIDDMGMKITTYKSGFLCSVIEEALSSKSKMLNYQSLHFLKSFKIDLGRLFFLLEIISYPT